MSGNPNGHSRVVKGRVIAGQELKDYAKRHGLCQICGQYQTHERKRTGMIKTVFVPMTVENNSGVTTVYKGHCIQPTCYPSVEFVKELLGEIKRPVPSEHKRPGPSEHKRPGHQQRSSDGSAGGGRGPIHHRQQDPRHYHGARPSAAPEPPSPHRPTYQPHRPHKPFTNLDGDNQTTTTATNTTTASSHHPSHSWQAQQDEISFVPGGGSSGQIPRFPRYPNNAANNSFDMNDSGNFMSAGNGSSRAMDAFYSSGIGGGVPGDPPTTHSFHNRGRGGQGGSSNGTSEESKQEETPADPILKALDAQLADGDYIGFLNRLDDPALQHYVAIDGLALFRKWVVRDQLEKPDGVVLGFDGWVKTIKTLVEDRFTGDREVTKCGLATFLSFATLSGNYRKYMIKRSGIDLLLKLVDDWQDDKEIVDLSCATISSICSSEKEGLSARYESAVFTVIRKLIEIIAAENGNGKEYSMLALNHLANQRKKAVSTNKTLGNDIRVRLAENETVIGEIIYIVRNPKVNLYVAEAGMCLLWRRSFPKDKDRENHETIPSIVELTETALYAMQNFSTPEIYQASCGLVANLALDDKQFPTDHAPKLMKSICSMLYQEDVEEATACCGVHAICNMVANSKVHGRVVSDPNLIPASFAMMKKFPGCEDLIEFGCLTIAQIARNDMQLKEMVVQNGGFSLVHRALEHFVILRGAEPSLVIKDATLCAMAAVSGCGSGAQEIVNSGLLEDLRELFSVEEDDDFRCIIQTILQNVQTAQSNGGFSTSGRSRTGRLSTDPQEFAQLAARAKSQEDLFSLFEELQELGQRGLPALAEHGFPMMLKLMSDFRMKSPVQEKGCAVLAQAYYQLPFTEMNAPVQLPNGSWTVVHKLEAFEAVHRALNLHRREPGVQYYACLAIHNFVACLYGKEQAIREIGNWAKPFFKEACEAIRNNPSDEFVIKSGVSLFSVLSTVYEPADFKQWRLPMLQIMLDALNRFTEDPDLEENFLVILVRCENETECLEFITNSGGVNMFMSRLSADDVNIVRGSSRVLASLVKNVFSASSQVSQMAHASQILLDCMASHQGDSQIELNICSILEALFNFGDFSDSATEQRITHVLCDSLQGGQTTADRNLTEKACRLLSLLIPLIEPEMVESMRLVLGPTLMRVLEENLEYPLVEAASMDALWTCCDQMDYFKHNLINEHSLRMIVQAMSLNLGSAELQRSGCSLLWILSGYGHGRQMIGEYGGVAAVVNAMLANSQSTVVQKEGLTVLKNLATASVNKRLISSTGGEDAVQYALWIHYREPQVISIALSALNNIAVDSETKSVAMMRENTLDVVIGAMKRFSEEEVVQKNACFYLKSCTYLRANLALMSRRRVELNQVLQRAASLYPDACRDRASSILAKIEHFR